MESNEDDTKKASGRSRCDSGSSKVELKFAPTRVVVQSEIAVATRLTDYAGSLATQRQQVA